MTTDEQNAFDQALHRANTAEITIAVNEALAGHRWITSEDARAHLTSKATRSKDGKIVFTSDKTNEDKTPVYTDGKTAASDLATARPHWIAAQITPGTGAQGASAGNPPPTTNITYAELLKPSNSQKLRDYLANKPEELARLRGAHYQE